MCFLFHWFCWNQTSRVRSSNEISFWTSLNCQKFNSWTKNIYLYIIRLIKNGSSHVSSSVGEKSRWYWVWVQKNVFACLLCANVGNLQYLIFNLLFCNKNGIHLLIWWCRWRSCMCCWCLCSAVTSVLPYIGLLRSVSVLCEIASASFDYPQTFSREAGLHFPATPF